MCMPKIKAPEPAPPPATRQTMKQPEIKARDDDPNRRRRGYAALMARSPSLQPAMTTASLGG